jgi:hypothetical protein
MSKVDLRFNRPQTQRTHKTLETQRTQTNMKRIGTRERHITIINKTLLDYK